MSTDTLMTDAPENTNQGEASSQPAAGEGTAPNTQGTEQQATDGQTPGTEQQAGAQGEAKADEGKPQGAPETYEFKAPEGATLDDAVVSQFSEVAKELNLPQDAAQKILDKMAPAMAARQAEQIEAIRTDWANTARADKEFGGEKLTENLGVAKKALDQFGTPELRALLNDTGMGNHPEVIRFMYRAGKAISEDGFVQGGRKSAPTDPAKRLFPNHA
jgi:hypothetical protein